MLKILKGYIMNTDMKIYIAGHNGMVGSAVVRLLQERGFDNIITRSRTELDLMNKTAVDDFFINEQPDVVVLAAAKVGGIHANNIYKAEFLYDNLQIQNNVIMAAYHNNVKKFCFLGSSCIYPCNSPQPMKEEYLLTGPFEPTNEGYAIAKTTGYKLCCYLAEQYGFPAVSLMPCNLYGSNDNFHPEHSHVFAALIRKFSEAVIEHNPEVNVWGTGIARREFLNVDDLAEAILYVMDNYEQPEFLNVGSGYDITIKELVNKISQQSGFTGKIIWDDSKPDGMLRKCMDCSKLKALGFEPKITLDDGINVMLEEYRQNRNNIRNR
jgi:GDP-L-fucose synthase